MHARLCLVAGLLLPLLGFSRALAQTPPAPNPPVPPPLPAVPGIAPPTDDGLPTMPDVTDPLLEELPPPPHVLGTWRQALRLVRSQSTQLRISEAQVLQAQGLARRALAAALPTLTGAASINRHLLFGTGVNFGAEGVQQNATIPDPATNLNAGLDFRQPLLALGAWYSIGTAKRQTRVAELNAKEAERVLLATAADSALGVITAERVADVSRVSLRSALSTLNLTERRALLGAASAVDVLRAQQEAALARAQVVQAAEAVMRAREALGLALGSDDAWGVLPTVSLVELSETARAVCNPVPAAENRTDVRAAQMRLEVAERAIEGVDYRYAPTLDLTSNLNYVNNTNRSANGEHVTWTVGALLSWPIYDGGDRQGDRLRADAEALVAREQLTEAKRAARLEVTQAERAVRVAAANLAVSRQSRDIALESARLSKIAFLNGSGTSFDLVDSARRLREAEIDLAIQEFELVRAQIAAFLARANCEL